jgi:flavin reductase (DIM6/NTAB) family NADH-FMN oxidoreductase RutF
VSDHVAVPSGIATAVRAAELTSDHGPKAVLSVTDPHSLRQLFGSFPSGVAALAALVDGRREVLVAASFQVGISLDPPMVLFAVQRTSTTWPALRSAGRVGVSVLSTAHGEIVRQLASKDKGRRFDGIDTVTTETGAVLLPDATLWMECEIAHDYDAGDHRLIVLTVIGSAVHDAGPLVFHGSRFHRLTSIAS